MIVTPGGRTLGRWQLGMKLGEGATSTVWSAIDPARGLAVALKVLKVDELDEASAQRRELRMKRESEALVRATHPNVVRIVEIGRAGRRLYLAMERIDGVDLRDWLAAEKRAWPEVVSVFLQCAHGLAAAHRAGIIHRDFKPANVMVEKTGRAVVTDFGLARGEAQELEGGALAVRLTAGGVTVGTPRYMAPEQHQAAPTDARTDQFALGVALFEALYGQHPYAPSPRTDIAPSVAYALATLSGRIVAPPEPVPPIPAGLAAAARRAIEIAPEARFRDLDELIATLEGVVRAEVRRQKRSMYGLLAGGVALAAVASAVTVSVLASAPPLCRARAQPVDAIAWVRRLAQPDAPSGAAARVQTALDEWSTWWQASVDAACKAARADGAPARLECLRDERRALEEALARAEQVPPVAALAAVSASLESRCDARATDAGANTASAAPRDTADAVDAVARSGRARDWRTLLAMLTHAAARNTDDKPIRVAPDELLPDAGRRARQREAIGLVLLAFDRRKPAIAHLERAIADAEAAGDRETAGRVHAALTEAEIAGAASDAAVGDLAGADARLTATLERLARIDAGAAARTRALEARAWVRGARGEREAAVADAREAASTSRETLGDAHPQSLSALATLGALEGPTGLAKVEEAARRLDGVRRADALLVASKLVGSSDPERARRLARDARTAAGGDRALGAAIDAWLAQLGG